MKLDGLNDSPFISLSQVAKTRLNHQVFWVNLIPTDLLEHAALDQSPSATHVAKIQVAPEIS